MLGADYSDYIRVIGRFFVVLAKRWIIGVAAGALVATGLAVAPALGAPDLGNRAVRHIVPAGLPISVGTFTPAAADPRLAALFARGGLDASGFRFTPIEARRSSRAVTVAVRSRSTRGTELAERSAAVAVAAPTVGLAPIAYNLGVAVGWRRFAMAGGLSHVDLAGQPGSREAMDVGVSYSASRFTGRVKAAADHPLAGTPQLTEDAPSYSLDVGGSYSLTHNLDVTAGVRYKTEREQRLQNIDDNRRDSQAVYVGTAFRF